MISSEHFRPDVLEFYRTLPFNVHGDKETSLAAIRARNSADAYPCLGPLLGAGTRVLEVGCGAGWLSACMAYYHQAQVAGIDFNPKVIAYAQEVANALPIKADFSTQDLFSYTPETQFDVVVSMGVLHHTDSCEAGIRRVAQEFVRPGGHFLLGLYHLYGRHPFLQHFEELRLAGADERSLFAEYRRLHSSAMDETQAQSWFRDQVLHPHETQHTLQEVSDILHSVDMEITSTSLNQFAARPHLPSIVACEHEQEALARSRLESGQYFPGFFVVLAKRNVDGG